MSDVKPLLDKGLSIDDKYVVGLLLSKDQFTQDYRVIDKAGNSFVLRLYTCLDNGVATFRRQKKLLKKQYSNLFPNVIDSGKTISSIEEISYRYLIFDSIAGERVSERLARLGAFSSETVTNMALALLSKVKAAHDSTPQVILNSLACDTLLIDMESKELEFHMECCNRVHSIGEQCSVPPANFEWPYLAPEAMEGTGSVAGDIYSAGVVIHKLLYGTMPWTYTLSEYKLKSQSFKQIITDARRSGLKSTSKPTELKEDLNRIIKRALSSNPDSRYQSIDEFMSALKGEETQQALNNPNSLAPECVRAGHSEDKGFNAIAGMEELKSVIKSDVIDALHDSETYRRYGLQIPNAMLLYGPPGCGKTFFALKMSEEVGCSFYHLKPSDIQSKWINGTQENIKNAFDEARENAPSVVFIDEIDSLVPRRDSGHLHHMHSSSVNEFLVQLNNCGEDGVFVIAATNQPAAIDPAVLRTGRFDKKYYLPTPDYEARFKLFERGLTGRPLSNDIDNELLAQRTEGYVASDIKFICDEAAREALKLKTAIKNVYLLSAIDRHPPSVSNTELLKYSEDMINA